MAVGDMVCLDLIQGDELSLGGNMQLLIGRDVFCSGFEEQADGHYHDRLRVHQDHARIVWAQIGDAFIRRRTCL